MPVTPLALVENGSGVCMLVVDADGPFKALDGGARCRIVQDDTAYTLTMESEGGQAVIGPWKAEELGPLRRSTRLFIAQFTGGAIVRAREVCLA